MAARRKQKNAQKVAALSDISRDYAITFVADGDLMPGPNFRIPIEIAHPAGERFIGLLKLSAQSAFAEQVFRQALRPKDSVELYLGGCTITARVASKDGKSGAIWVHADDVFRGLAKPVLLADDVPSKDRDAKADGND